MENPTKRKWKIVVSPENGPRTVSQPRSSGGSCLRGQQAVVTQTRPPHWQPVATRGRGARSSPRWVDDWLTLITRCWKPAPFEEPLLLLT
eukprot:scaffold633_cov288-Ochromonas_danica.AAC.22